MHPDDLDRALAPSVLGDASLRRGWRAATAPLRSDGSESTIRSTWTGTPT